MGFNGVPKFAQAINQFNLDPIKALKKAPQKPLTIYTTPIIIKKRVSEFWKDYEANKKSCPVPNLLEFYIYLGTSPREINEILINFTRPFSRIYLYKNIDAINMSMDKAIENVSSGRIAKLQQMGNKANDLLLPNIIINIPKNESDNYNQKLVHWEKQPEDKNAKTF